MAEVDSDTQSEGRPLIYEFEDQQLLDLAEELSHSNAAIKAETEVFERYFSRIDPKDLLPQPLAEQPLLGLSAQEFSQFRGRRKSKSRSMTAERLVRLTVEQKCDVAQRELEEMRDALERLKEGSERVLSNYKATVEESEIRMCELKKASYEFDRDIGRSMFERKGVMMGAEKVIRYIEDKSRTKASQDTLIEKLRLKKAALKVQKRKLQMQLKQKEEMGEALHEVDFQQLKIENSQYLEKIDERNQDLLRLKLLAGNTLQVLNTYKDKAKAEHCLHEMNRRRDIDRLWGISFQKEEMGEALHEVDFQQLKIENSQYLEKIDERNQDLLGLKLLAGNTLQVLNAYKERSKAETMNKRLRGQLSDYQVPNVLDYVTGKASHSDLEQSVHIWERKVEISEVSEAHLKNVFIIIYFLADALIQGDLQLLQDITLFLHTITLFSLHIIFTYNYPFIQVGFYWSNLGKVPCSRVQQQCPHWGLNPRPSGQESRALTATPHCCPYAAVSVFL
ncbi:Coiled-coil domain-containing protein 113 [Acipenser ruthenus]|uniref:Cilia- and flagella-associated protein 263 n=1 Tax=Acipenser ruthenus TaxID=7906 RepID=A0A444U339_ACIRT|nr:Coiled-coil domain-containing protein 113 [Acipenser ruthenus]